MFKHNYLKYKRNKTHKVLIGNIPLGEDESVRIQSMTNTDTNDIEATVNQIIEIADVGADYVRLTVQTSFVAEKLKDIKKLLKEKGYDIPLIADIHFSPKAAEIAAAIIEKVRINPGNYTDLKQFKHIEYTDEEYQKEVENLKMNFIPLLKTCKKYNTAIRIGTNHGSLSDRILSRYGDTPGGMVEATMEFLRICKEETFTDVVISMKASNPIVMIYANRLLVMKMHEEKMDFPLHLGVTEAGNNLEGRIKSALGIGTLLVDGIGDTIRVSLTEAPAKEIPVARKITKIFKPVKFKDFSVPIKVKMPERSFFEYKKRKSFEVLNIGGENVPVVISRLFGKDIVKEISDSGFIFDKKNKQFGKTDLSADFLFVNTDMNDFKLPSETKIISLVKDLNPDNLILVDYKNFVSYKYITDIPHFIKFDISEIQNIEFESLKNLLNSVFVLDLTNSVSPVHCGRAFFLKLEEFRITNPVILRQSFLQINEYALLKASAEIGALFIDGFGDGIMISGGKNNISQANELNFGILQACRTRISKTEYISCPSCGRTLFNLEEITAKIKEKTAHLKGVKIAIMGCIVNGLGEMADADYGYVGTGKGKVTLYKNKDVIRRNVPENKAPDILLQLIEQYL